MPWTAEYGPDSADIRYDGLTTGGEILEAKRQFYSHAFEKPARFVLCDFTGVQRFQVASNDVQRIVGQDRAAAAANPRLAEVVIAPKPFEYGLARMWELQVDDARPRTAVVKTRAEAVEWLKGLGL